MTNNAPTPSHEDSSDSLAELSKFRLNPDYAATLGLKKTQLTIRVSKPDKQAFVRVHPDPAYRLEALILELRETKESYIIDPNLITDVGKEAHATLLLTTITRQHDLSLWPIRLPNPDGKFNEWSHAALAAADEATKHWVRVMANTSVSGYDVYKAAAAFPDPQWPDIEFEEILDRAFKGRVILKLDHPVLRQLRGEI